MEIKHTVGKIAHHYHRHSKKNCSYCTGKVNLGGAWEFVLCYACGRVFCYDCASALLKDNFATGGFDNFLCLRTSMVKGVEKCCDDGKQMFKIVK